MREEIPPNRFDIDKKDIPVEFGILLGKKLGQKVNKVNLDPDEEMLRNFDPDDDYCKKSLRETIRKRSGDTSFLSRKDLVSSLLSMVEASDEEERLQLTGLIMNVISHDKEERFSMALVKGGAVEQFTEMIDNMLETDERSSRLIANTLCVIGHLIPHHDIRKLSSPLIGRFLEYTLSSHLAVRGNGYFCLRMMVERGPGVFPDISKLIEHLLLGTMDDEYNVQEESLGSIQFLLENNAVDDIDPIIERVPLLEMYSGSDNTLVAEYAERILYLLSRKNEKEVVRRCIT